jgi:membrane-bound lytic murein transglycosylase MltF
MLQWLAPLGLGLCLAALPAAAQSPTSTQHPSRVFVDSVTKPWTGDLDGMIDRRLIRVLTVYSKTIYFIDRGTQRGTAHDSLKMFEETLNKRLKTRHLRVAVVFVPVSRDELLPALIEGRGDIAAANLTITPEREALVGFTEPLVTGVNEIVVTGPASPAVASLDDLAGKDVFVRRSSSYYASLVALNARFKQEGKAAITLTPAPESLEDEDLLEMLNAGLVKLVVIDSHKAGLWKQVFPDLTLHPEIVVREGGGIGWAVRKDSPRLREALDAFAAKNRKSAFANETLRRYLKNTRYVKNAAADAEMRKFRATVALFRKYGERYALDWMLMAAQGYQESRLDQNARSPVGAIGVMQVMPATAGDLKVGDITQLEPNVHAGVKYIRFMIEQYYKDEPMDELNKHLFAFAAYNAGPGRVSSLRREAQRKGLDPNVWFHNVERIAAAKIGRETVTYVSNIYKYYVAYALVQGEYHERIAAKQELTASSPGSGAMTPAVSAPGR